MYPTTDAFKNYLVFPFKNRKVFLEITTKLIRVREMI